MHTCIQMDKNAKGALSTVTAYYRNPCQTQQHMLGFTASKTKMHTRERPPLDICNNRVTFMFCPFHPFLTVCADPRGAIELAKTADVNALSGLVKLYLRELPEALFTDALYPQLVESMGLSDPEAKERCLIALKNSLPEPNRTVVNYLISHLLK